MMITMRLWNEESFIIVENEKIAISMEIATIVKELSQLNYDSENETYTAKTTDNITVSWNNLGYSIVIE